MPSGVSKSLHKWFYCPWMLTVSDAIILTQWFPDMFLLDNPEETS